MRLQPNDEIEPDISLTQSSGQVVPAKQAIISFYSWLHHRGWLDYTVADAPAAVLQMKDSQSSSCVPNNGVFFFFCDARPLHQPASHMFRRFTAHSWQFTSHVHIMGANTLTDGFRRWQGVKSLARQTSLKSFSPLRVQVHCGSFSFVSVSSRVDCHDSRS